MAISPLTLSVGQNQTFQKQLTKLNTDIQFSHVAIGEGPIYRINPNGVQDIRVDGKFIDDLISQQPNFPKEATPALILSILKIVASFLFITSAVALLHIRITLKLVKENGHLFEKQ